MTQSGHWLGAEDKLCQPELLEAIGLIDRDKHGYESPAILEDYAKTYDAFDIKRMITYAHCPMITVQQGEPKVHATPEEVEGFFSQLLVWFRGIEHEHASISHLEVQPLGEKSAFAKVVWRSRRKDGKPDLEWPTAYHLVNPGSENSRDNIAV